jgi:hypothetical protein
MNAETAATTKAAVILKTADQYDLWKARIADMCWAATGKDLFKLADDECEAALEALEGDDDVEDAAAAAAAAKAKAKAQWVHKCWTLVTCSLHDDIYRKVNHVERGHMSTLLKEISHALVVNNLEEVQPLRLELYGASMLKDCGSDLQVWISFMMERTKKLEFLEKPVEEEEQVAIFLKGLHPTPFQQLQVYFAIPGNLPETFDAAVSIVRKFAATPVIAAELASQVVYHKACSL